MPIMNALGTRYNLHQALRWRDLLWTSILDDLEWRDPARAQAVYDVLAEQPTVAIVGHSTTGARVAWPYLDTQARDDWLWVAQFVQRVWFRGMLGVAVRRQEIRATASTVSASSEAHAWTFAKGVVADGAPAPE